LDISLITSLYQSDQFIQSYSGHVLRVARDVRDFGLSLEIIIVANDASQYERQVIEQLESHTNIVGIKSIYVDRETLYASWNRGIALATGTAIGFWNVDDIRTSDGIIAGYRHISEGHNLVLFAWIVHEIRSWFGLFTVIHKTPRPAESVTTQNAPESMKAGAFFMFTRPIFDIVGPFDERFLSGGDFDWYMRAAQKHTFFPCNELAGYFFYHGKGLSHNALLQHAEDNVAFIKNGYEEYLKPTDPEFMRQIWKKWQHDYTLTPELEDQLWGKITGQHWDSWQKQRNAKLARRQRSDNLRMLPRLFIDKTGLRPLLARLGIVKGHRPVT
jgi:glycosyltransferase involved in cell wall biosynthesis